MSASKNGMRFRFTILIDVTPAISAQAMSTPATGLTVRPIEAARFIGNNMEVVDTPNLAAIFGMSGAKAKNEALPLPISIEARKMRSVMTIAMPIAPSPAL